VLQEPAYRAVRDIIIDDIIKTIDREGRYGQELRPIVENTLKESKFKPLVAKMFENIMKQTDISPQDCQEALSTLMEEDIAVDIKHKLDDQVEERAEKQKSPGQGSLGGRDMGRRLWRDVPKRYIGKRISAFRDVVNLIHKNTAVRLTFLGGITLLVVSTLLSGSVYKAIIAGLTLMAMPAVTLREKLANVLGALGGILIFFVSMSLVFQYLFLVRSRDDRVRQIAARYLDEKRHVKPSLSE
jgi:hypothetical protein